MIGNKIRQNNLVANHKFEMAEEQTGEQMEEITVGNHKVIAIAETKEEAKKIAELYGMELVEYSYKIATYMTQKEPVELMKWGKEQGYPTIAVNQEYAVD